MTRYLIDIRLMGPVKQRIRGMSEQLREEFGIGRKLVAPHITLAGPFATGDEDRLVADFSRICGMQDTVPGYSLGGYGFFDDTRVIFVAIIPDERLKQFRYRLAQTIAPYCTLRDYDRDSEEDFRFHATLAMKLDWLTFQRIRWRFRTEDPVVYRTHPIRVTLLRNTRILCEYDFARARMLTRAQARGRALRKRDSEMLRIWEGGDAGG